MFKITLNKILSKFKVWPLDWGWKLNMCCKKSNFINIFGTEYETIRGNDGNLGRSGKIEEL